MSRTTITPIDFIYRHKIIFQLIYTIGNGIIFRKQLEKILLDFNCYQEVKTANGIEKKPYSESSIKQFISKAKEFEIIKTSNYLNTKNQIITVCKKPIILLYPELDYNNIKGYNRDEFSYQRCENRLFKTELFYQEYKDYFLDNDQFEAINNFQKYKYISLFCKYKDLISFYEVFERSYYNNDNLKDNKQEFIKSINKVLNPENRKNSKDLSTKRKEKSLNSRTRNDYENLFTIYSMHKKNVYFYRSQKSAYYIVWLPATNSMDRDKLHLLVRDIVVFNYCLRGNKYSNCSIYFYSPDDKCSNQIKSLLTEEIYSYSKAKGRQVTSSKDRLVNKYHLNGCGEIKFYYEHFDFNNEYRNGFSLANLEYSDAKNQRREEASIDKKVKEKLKVETQKLEQSKKKFEEEIKRDSINTIKEKTKHYENIAIKNEQLTEQNTKLINENNKLKNSQIELYKTQTNDLLKHIDINDYVVIINDNMTLIKLNNLKNKTNNEQFIKNIKKISNEKTCTCSESFKSFIYDNLDSNALKNVTIYKKI